MKWRVRRNVRKCKTMRKMTSDKTLAPSTSRSSQKSGLMDWRHKSHISARRSCSITHMHVSIARLYGALSPDSESIHDRQGITTMTYSTTQTYLNLYSKPTHSISRCRNWQLYARESPRQKSGRRRSPFSKTILHVSAQSTFNQ